MGALVTGVQTCARPISAAAVAALDSSGEWAADGSVSMASWMRVRLRMSHGDASQLLKMSRLARSLPLTAAAWEQGRLSSGQIRVVVANVKTRHVDLFQIGRAHV